MPAPAPAPVRAPTRITSPEESPDRNPDWEMDPDLICPAQKEKTIRTITPFLP